VIAMSLFRPNPQQVLGAQAAGAGTTIIVTGLVSAVQCNLPGGGNAVRIVNRGAGDAFVVPQSNAALNVPLATVPAANSPGGFPVLANAPAEVITLAPGVQSLSIICSANATLYVTPGQN
jgi:hypothetical protein